MLGNNLKLIIIFLITKYNKNVFPQNSLFTVFNSIFFLTPVPFAIYSYL